MKLFARLAEENVGFIDWTEYLPKVLWEFSFCLLFCLVFIYFPLTKETYIEVLS